MSRKLSNEKTEQIYEMTNKEAKPAGLSSCLDGGCNPRTAAAMHLVSQVLDEAYVIANAARDSGQPWRNLSIFKDLKTSKQSDMEHDDPSFEASKGDCDLNDNNMDDKMIANIVVTSTPQKLSIRIDRSDEGEGSIPHNDSTFIGQGDEDLESQQNDLVKSTSMFINHLFDMGEVEPIVLCDDAEVIQSTPESDELLAETMNKIVESYVANTLIPSETYPLVPTIKIIDRTEPGDISRSDSSDYSFLADAFGADISRDVAFYIDGEVSYEKHQDYDKYGQAAVVEEIIETALKNTFSVSNFVQQVDNNIENVIQKDDVVLYEDAYATLNRDFDQGSDEDGFPILQDPKTMTLQEVQLMAANTSDDELSNAEYNPKQKLKDHEAPTVSGVSGSRKSTLARRCRMQGARLLACLRGWWRRKTPGKRKDSHYRGIVLGMCPLSPDARRRACSLTDNRLLRSPSPSRPVVWKFNTVNEAVVSNSNHWKEYTFDAKPEDCGEF